MLSLLERSSEAFVAFDRDWRYLYVNAAAERLLRRPRADLVGRTIWEMFPGSEDAPFAREFRRAAAEGVTAELRVEWPPLGAWFDVRACPSEEGLTVYFHDVTAQVTTERALRESRDHIRLITDSVPAIISYVDHGLAYRFANRAYQDWFGLAPEQVIGLTIPDLLGAEAFELRRPFVERALRGERVRFDAPTPHKELGARETDVTYVPDVSGGEVRGFYVLIHDVTERKRTEEALRQAAERERLRAEELQAVMEHVPAAVWIATDATGRHVTGSAFAYEVLRTPAGANVSRSAPASERVDHFRMLDGEGRELAAAEMPLQKCIATGEAQAGVEMRVSFGDDAPAILYGNAAPLFDAQGRTRGAVAAFVDVTQLKAAQDAARQAIDTLRGSEARLARAQRIARLGDWEIDLKTDAVSWSDEMYRLFGVAPGAFVPTVEGFLARVPPEDHAPMRRAYDAALAGHAPYDVDHRIVTQGGSVRVVNEQAEVVRDDAGAPVRVVGTMHDVTDRHRAEADLRESRQRLRAALEAADMGTWRLDLRTGTATRDAGMSRLLGLAHEEASEPAEAFFARVHPEDRAGVDAAVRRALADRGTYFAEFRVVLPDGSARWLREQGKVQDDGGDGAQGEPASLTGAAVDVTGRKQAEQAVRDANRRLLAVVEASPLAVMTVDDRGVVVLWNPAAERMFGWTADEAVGQFLPTVPEDQLDAALQILRGTLAGRSAAGAEVRRRRKDGSVFDAAVWTSRLLDESGRPIAALGILADVSDRKRAESALDQARRDAEAARSAAESANRAKDQFLAVLSHELRTPLTPVVMTLAGLEMDRSLSQDVRDDLAMIRRNVELETKLIDDLLDVTRITHGKLRLHAQPTNVHALVESVLDILRSDVRGKGVELSCDLRAADAVVSGDAARLQQVVWNVVKNAIKFAPDSGHVWVRTTNPTPRTLALEVRDDGVGIDPAALPRLFNAFEQAEQNVTRQFGGLGLGLAISKALVELHGGTIRAESAGRGRGATFVVELPTVGAIERLVGRIQPPRGVSAGAAGPRPVRVLLVDDHADTLRTLKRLLERMGYQVLPAASAAAALGVLASEPVDVLVSDIGLPDATGHELMRKVRASHDLPGIAVSGYGMDTDLKNSRDAGFLTHITKPIDLGQLDAAIRSAVRRAPTAQ